MDRLMNAHIYAHTHANTHSPEHFSPHYRHHPQQHLDERRGRSCALMALCVCVRERACSRRSARTPFAHGHANLWRAPAHATRRTQQIAVRRRQVSENDQKGRSPACASFVAPNKSYFTGTTRTAAATMARRLVVGIHRVRQGLLVGVLTITKTNLDPKR